MKLGHLDLAALMVFMKITSPLGSSGQTVAASLFAFVLLHMLMHLDLAALMVF